MSRSAGLPRTGVAFFLICSSLLTPGSAPCEAKDKKVNHTWKSGTRYSVESTGFRAMRYEHKSLTLTVERASGTIHEYYNVPHSVFVKLMNTRFKTGVMGAYIENRCKRKQVNVTAQQKR